MQSSTGLPVLLFDVNETLVDLGPLKERVNAALQTSDGATLWFTTMLHYSVVMTVGGRYSSFTDIGVAVLQMLAKARGIAMEDEAARQILGTMRQLPAHADVRPALVQLRRAGYRMAALTNSPIAGVRAQLAAAGIADCFERQLSVESVGKYKPHPEVYRWAASEMATAPADCMLVAAHGWDTAGAKWAGLQTAFIERHGQQEFALADAADIHVPDMAALVLKLGA